MIRDPDAVPAVLRSYRKGLEGYDLLYCNDLYIALDVIMPVGLTVIDVERLDVRAGISSAAYMDRT